MRAASDNALLRLESDRFRRGHDVGNRPGTEVRGSQLSVTLRCLGPVSFVAMKTLPEWIIPANLTELLAENVDLWEDDRWHPILLSVLGGISYEGRDIPLSWQVEFDPSDPELAAANAKIEASGVEADGYGWAQVIGSVVSRQHTELAEELHFEDTEADTLVVWVESEESCRLLMNVVWSLAHAS